MALLPIDGCEPLRRDCPQRDGCFARTNTGVAAEVALIWQSMASARVDSPVVTSATSLVLIGLAVLVLIVAVVAGARAGLRMPEGSTRSPGATVDELEALDAEDLDELLEVTNARRRARGLAARTRDDAGREFGDATG